jgi:hypothetical protein
MCVPYFLELVLGNLGFSVFPLSSVVYCNFVQSDVLFGTSPSLLRPDASVCFHTGAVNQGPSQERLYSSHPNSKFYQFIQTYQEIVQWQQ